MADLIAALATAAGAGPTAETDPNFNQTTLLLHGDGTDGAQNNTFLDSSTNNFTITRNGNTTQGTFSPFSLAEGEFSNFFDGTGDFISVADSADFTMGSGDFTVQCWVYSSKNSASDQYILGQVTSGGQAANTSFQLYKKATTNVAEAFVYMGGSKVATSTATIPVGQWVHLAMVRDGGTLRLYVNGVQDGTNATLSTTAITDSGGSFAVGRTGDYNGLYFEGYVSNVSVVKGTCLFPSGTTFTPSTSPLSTSTSGQSVLLCTANRFIDTNTATTAKTVTVGGNTSIQPFSPFAPSAAYDSSVNGASGYFDGTGDYLTVPDNAAFDLGSGAFTIECFVYLKARAASYDFFVGQWNNSSDAWLLFSQGNTLQFWANGVSVKSETVTITLNQWYHFACTRDGSNNLRLYANGVKLGSDAAYSTTIINSTANPTIGTRGDGNAGTNINGYMTSVRVLKGAAEYTGSTYTIPTAPETSDANTSLLLNFTNAGIFDNTGKNNLETVGNAQIDTTVKQYGTGSMEFDGTGDWLLLANNVNQQLGTGNFTIEFWVYLATGDTGSNRGLVAKGTSTTGFLVSLNTTEKVVFTFATSTITSTGAITLDAWNHIAVVREGTGSNETKIYIAGTNDGTGTVSTDFNQTSVMYVGANRTGGDPMKGYIDDLRITKGVARYTTTFTPPTKAFPDL